MHTLTLTGELDRMSASILEAELERLYDAPNDGVMLDLSKLERIDATGVAVIAFRCGLCERRGEELRLIHGKPAVRRAFELAGVANKLPFEARGEYTSTPAPLSQNASLEQQPIAEVAGRRARTRVRTRTRRVKAPASAPARRARESRV